MQALLTTVLTVALITIGVKIFRLQTKTKLTSTQLLLRKGKDLAVLYIPGFILLLALFYIRGALASIGPIAIAIVIFVPITIVLRIKNAELTEMQLFKKYWPVWIGLVILILAAVGWSIVMIFRDFLDRVGN